MLQFILTNILMLSIGAMLYLIARALPRVGEDDLVLQKRPVLERWITSEIPERFDAFMNRSAGKLFRKLKMLLITIDTYLTKRLKKMRTDEARKPKIDFSEIRQEADKAETK